MAVPTEQQLELLREIRDQTADPATRKAVQKTLERAERVRASAQRSN